MEIPKKRAKPSNTELRKEEVAKATWQVLAEEGLAGASMRAIAAKLGTTTGTLVHYFPSKDSILEYTASTYNKLVHDRETRAYRGDPESRLWRFIHAFLSINQERRNNQRVWLTFITVSFRKPKLRAENEQRLRGFREDVQDLVEENRTVHKRKSTITPEDEADLLICFTEGLSVLVTVDPRQFSPKRQRALAAMAYERLIQQPPY